jgi:hypothetical protein
MIAMAMMSSTIATVSRNNLTPEDTRSPSRASTPTANAMSVAAGMAQPEASSLPAVTARKIPAGSTTPPIAAIAGSAAALRSRSSPVTSSRLISRPTTKKNSAMRPSLTQ